MSIPKKIHYCWLSGEPFPSEIQSCIESWHRYMPEYEFKLWDMNSFDVDSVQYVKQAIDKRKWAFASDYIRLWALYNYGGIYLDSDIEVLKSFNPLLSERAFTGFEVGGRVAAWIFGSEPGNSIIERLLRFYYNKYFLNTDGSFDMTPNTLPVTKIFAENGLTDNNVTQRLENITVFSSDYFSPFNPWTKEKKITTNSYAMHLFKGAWMNDKNDAFFLESIEANVNLLLKKIPKAKKINIYGAGLVGHLMLDVLRTSYNDVSIGCFIVSDSNYIFNEVSNIRVLCVNDEKIDRNEPIIIATMPKDYDNIKTKLHSNNYENFFTLI